MVPKVLNELMETDVFTRASIDGDEVIPLLSMLRAYIACLKSPTLLPDSCETDALSVIAKTEIVPGLITYPCTVGRNATGQKDHLVVPIISVSWIQGRESETSTWVIVDKIANPHIWPALHEIAAAYEDLCKTPCTFRQIDSDLHNSHKLYGLQSFPKYRTFATSLVERVVPKNTLDYGTTGQGEG